MAAVGGIGHGGRDSRTGVGAGGGAGQVTGAGTGCQTVESAHILAPGRRGFSSTLNGASGSSGGATLAGVGWAAGVAGGVGAPAWSRFRRINSNSMSCNRRDNSSRRCPAPTARTISQITTAVGIPKTIRMMKGIAESISCLSRGPAGLLNCILLPRTNSLQAAKNNLPGIVDHRCPK